MNILYLSAYESCPKPCTEVAYTFAAEPFTANTVEDLSELSQCSWLERPSVLSLQFSRKIQFEYVSCQLSRDLTLNTTYFATQGIPLASCFQLVVVLVALSLRSFLWKKAIN